MYKTLNDVCELIVDSEHKTAPTQGVGLPMIRTPNIGSGRIVWGKMQFVSEDTFQKWTRRAVPQEDDLILAREAPVGNVIRVPESNKFCLGQRTVLLRPDKSKVDPKYLMYYLLSPPVRERLLSVSYGATVDHLNMSEIRSLDISDMPKLEVQKIVGSAIFAFDNLIEINERKIKVLEEMAWRIYREWFVDFKFPGHEKVNMVDSGHPDFGMIPEGWKVEKLGMLADVAWGDTSKTKEIYVAKGFLAYSASGPDGFLNYFDFDRDGIVLSAIGANCGVTWFATGKWSCIKNTIKFWSRSENAGNAYLYFATAGKSFWPKRGSAQPFISLGDARDIQILKPVLAVSQEYERLVLSMLKLIAIQKNEVHSLSSMRDLLLPKLISGEIDVSNLNVDGIVDEDAKVTSKSNMEDAQDVHTRSNH